MLSTVGFDAVRQVSQDHHPGCRLIVSVAMTTGGRHRQHYHLQQQQPVDDVTAVGRCVHATFHFKRHITSL